MWTSQPKGLGKEGGLCARQTREEMLIRADRSTCIVLTAFNAIADGEGVVKGVAWYGHQWSNLL